MRVVFIGAASIGWHCLKALLESKSDVVGIFTADKQQMVQRSGMHPDYFAEFEALAGQWGVPLHKVDTVDTPLDVDSMKSLQPDLIFCIGWPKIVAKDILNTAAHGCIGIHPTLLPQRRGGAPINWCLIDGLNKSGVTLFYFDQGIDSGDIIAQQEFDIALEDTAGTVLDRVTRIATQLLITYYPALERGEAPRIPQDHSKATYTRRRRPDDGRIEWRMSSLSIHNWVRALTAPFPGAFTTCKGARVIIWESQLLEAYTARFGARPGEIMGDSGQDGIIVATGDYCIVVKRAELNGGTLTGGEVTRKLGVRPGTILGEA